MNASVFVATTGKGIARASRDRNDGWTVESSLADQDVRCLAVSPFNRDVVYAGTQGKGLLCSYDQGQTWRSSGLAGQVVKSITPSPVEPDVLYAGTKPPALFVSRDGGAGWTELESFRQMRRRFWYTPAEPGGPYIQGIALSPTDPLVIIAGVEYGAVLRSADGGKTWQGHLKGAIRDCHSLIFHPNNGNWVYEGGGGWAAAVSRDGGNTWRQPRKGLGWRTYGWACAADPKHPEVWYVSAAPLISFPNILAFPVAHWDGKANAHIFRSTGGAPWKKLNGGLPQPLSYMAYALLTDPEATGHLYAGLSNGAVWFSADYGDRWQQLPFNLGSIARSLIMI